MASHSRNIAIRHQQRAIVSTYSQRNAILRWPSPESSANRVGRKSCPAGSASEAYSDPCWPGAKALVPGKRAHDRMPYRMFSSQIRCSGLRRKLRGLVGPMRIRSRGIAVLRRLRWRRQLDSRNRGRMPDTSLQCGALIRGGSRSTFWISSGDRRRSCQNMRRCP